MRIYEVCIDCGCDTFRVFKEDNKMGTLEECDDCGSNNIGFKGDVNVLEGES